MQTRYRWFNVSPLTKAGIAKIAEGFQKRAYSRAGGAGFTLEVVRSDRITGSYTQRREFDEAVEDPAGGVISVHRVAFDHCAFSVGLIGPNLRISNPAKLSRVLTETVADALDYTAAVVPIEVDPLRWLNAVAQEVDHLAVGSLRTLPFEVTNEISGIVRLNGSGDIVKQLRNLVGRRKVTVSNVICGITHAHTTAKLELRSSGSAVVQSNDPDIIAQLLGKALLSCNGERVAE